MHHDKTAKRQKITESWDRFALSVRDLAEAEWHYSKSKICDYLKIPDILEDFPREVVGLAFIPPIFYLAFFNFFSFWQWFLSTPTEPWVHLLW